MSKTSDSVRKAFKAGDDIRDAGLTTPDDIVRFDDIKYAEDDECQKLDVYRPKDAGDKLLPVIVSVHGGGWVYGDKERYQYYCMSLAGRGFAVVNYTYRLAPEHKFPAPLEDENHVFHWVLNNKDEYHFDTGNIFAVGDSAGGQLLGLYSCLCTNPAYADNFEFKAPDGFVPKAVGLNCGAYVIDMSEEGQMKALMEDLLPDGGTEEEMGLVNVIPHITENFPPAFFMTSTGDFLKAQAPMLEKKLLEKSVPFVFRFYGDKDKNLPHVFHCNMRSEDARQCNDEECDFFRRYTGWSLR